MALWIPSGAGVGSKSSDNISICWTCRNRSFPHEAIRFKRVQGRSVKFDYFCTSEPHLHRNRDRKEATDCYLASERYSGEIIWQN
ncbi:MAG: hypothetical protein WBQ25_19135 [Nitrososphaeraceae archaeon]